MTFFNLPENPSPLQHLSRSLGQGIGAGQQMSLTQKLEESQKIREEEREQTRRQEGITTLQKKLKELGPEASISDKYGAIIASPVNDSSKKSLIESLQFEGAKNFINKLREKKGDIDVADILEGESLGYIPPGSGQELIRSIGGTREREGAAKIFTPTYQKSLESAKSAREGIATVRRGKQLLQTKNFGPLSFDNLVTKLGIPGAASPEAQEFQASILGFLTGEKSRFGVRLSDADLRLIQNKMPDIARTKEGNEALLNLRESEYLFHELENKAQTNILKKNKGFTYDFQEQVDQEVENLLNQKPEIQRLYSSSAEALKRLSGETAQAETKEFSHDQLPPASQHDGEYFEDEKGNVFKSNGRSWRKQ